MNIRPAKKETRETIADILSIFLKDHETFVGPLSELLGKIYARFSVHPLDANGLSAILRKCSDVGMRDSNLYLLLEPTKDNKILPLVTLYSSDKWVHFRVYALLTMLDEGSKMEVLAIRFETDEGDPERKADGSHDFCHAQLCNVIRGPVKASTPKWIPDSQPSIPVDADDQISLVLCMLTSLYGGAHVRRRIIQSGDVCLRKHLDSVRALQDRSTDN